MQRGEPCAQINAPGLCRGVCKSLSLAHSVGIFHCDLRRSNVLKFGADDFQLVDFGLSCSIQGEYNDPYDLQRGGSQASSVGPRVRRLLDANTEVVWTAADDYEMLLHMMGAFQSDG